MKCKAVLKEIEELDAGASLSALADEHLLACASCRAFADERAALKQLVGSLESVSAPPDFDWRLRARLAEARSERGVRERLFPYFAPGAQAIAIAATIVILLVAAVAYRQIMPLQRSVKESSAIASIKIKGDERVSSTSDSKGAAYSRQGTEANATTRPRVLKSAKPSGARMESARLTTQPQQRIFSTDFGSRGAEEFTSAKRKESSVGAGPVISVRVPSTKAAQLMFEDGQGTRRTLFPVNFGGQELIERPDKARLVPASEKGIW
jgi:hypothetical protein